ncbi:Telomeric DNA-binding factor trf1 [Verticillium dahliae VDG2]|nr:Telomeric DNA-binding factor trf1 [Verticillium dahliae VDG2]
MEGSYKQTTTVLQLAEHQGHVNLGQDVLLMGYIETRTEDGGLRLRASTGLALFAALALPLVSVTVRALFRTE